MAKAPKKKGFSLQGFDVQAYRQSEAYAQAIDALYNEAVKDFAKVASGLSFNPNKPFSFNDYPAAKRKADEIISGLSANMKSVVVQGTRKQWLFACEKNDEFLNHILNTSKIPKKTLAKYQDKNLDALSTFQSRKINGLDISQRIWNYTGQMKTQMELGIDIALGDGRSANALSRDLRQYLVDPDKLFRRVRDKHGNLVLSKNARAFHPGQGKYRSSYKNAMRLTRTEINMAYRESDQLRWDKLDFIVGFEVVLSNNHTLNGKPFVDICDDLKGKYPKTFKFKGWHPQCRCHANPILMDPDEFNTDELNELKAAINGDEYKKFTSRNEVTDVPQGFKDWVNDNAERIKGWKSAPYFIKDNFKGGEIAGGLNINRLNTAISKNIPAEISQNVISDIDIENNQKWVSELSKKEKSAFSEYSTGYYQRTNDKLRGIRDDESKYTDERIVLMQDALKKAPKVSVDTYRGMYFYEKDVFDKFESNIKVGNIYIEKGFMSTTRNKDIVEAFTREETNNVIFNIKGKNGVIMDKLARQSKEAEVLFNSGSKFEIVKVETQLRENGLKTLIIDITEL